MRDLISPIRSWLSRLMPSTTVRVRAASGSLPSNVLDISSGGATNALQSAAVWACVRLVSQSIACLPTHIFEETEEGKIKARKHPLYRVLTKQPNAVMTMSQMLQTTTLHLELYGNAYWIPQLSDGEVIALWPLDPTRMRILTSASGALLYRYTDGSVTVDYDPLSLLHFRIFSLDGIVGLSPLDYHRLTVDSEAAAHLYAATLYRNGGQPSGVLEYQNVLKKEQKDAIRESWMQLHGGADGVGRVAVLDGGMKYSAISVPLQQLEYISQQRFSVEQIARIYGVPAHMIGASNAPTYASVEQQSLEFSQYTQQPIVTGIEETIQTTLLDDPYIFRFNMSAFQRADINSRYRAYATGRQWGWFSVNDIRELEEMNRIGEEGDIYLQPLNMIPASEQQFSYAPKPTEEGTVTNG